MKEALDIQVKGIVQGVGFRPFVYRLAKKYLIDGWVLNATDGVFIHAEGETKLLDEFVIELSENPPAASRVEEVTLKEVPLEDFDSFEIRFSDAGAVEKTTLVSPDLATCDDCARELFNPNDRRYRYPSINCTNCGPRFTIIEQLPYDRKSTASTATSWTAASTRSPTRASNAAPISAGANTRACPERSPAFMPPAFPPTCRPPLTSPLALPPPMRRKQMFHVKHCALPMPLTRPWDPSPGEPRARRAMPYLRAPWNCCWRARSWP